MKWKQRLKHAGILTGVFLLAVIIFAYITNRGNDNMTADMGGATYPQVSFSYQGYSINTLSGYSGSMDIPSMRDTITPIENGKIDLAIEAYENKVTGLKWCVYSLDGTEELLNGEESDPAENVSLEIDPSRLTDREGVLEIVLTTESEEDIYYYTRVTDASGKDILENLNYIQTFHEGALSKDSSAGIESALEPGEESDNSTYQHVTIHSDYDHVTWGNLNPQVEQGERWMIKEINSVSISVEIQFLARCTGEENETDLYQTKEYFRVRHVADSGSTYLLDYDRTMEQIFDPTKQVLSENGVLLGIADSDTPYLVNGDGSVVSFVTANELWNYNKNTDEASLVFSFMSAENTDPRNLVRQHKIWLLEIDDAGNTMFAVYGYMNRGEHEGQVGAAVYYYDIEQNSVEEKVFVAIDQSYAHAENELGKVMYYSADRNVLYTMVGGTLYEYDVEKDWNEAVVEGLEEGQYAVSADGRLVGYQVDGDIDTARTVKVLNLETGKEWEVTCGENECIRPLGFMNDDVVYGVASTSDTGRTVSGEAVVPMYKVEIQDSKGTVKETYQTDGAYVLGISIEDNMITLNRVSKNGEIYTNISPDYITNNTEREESNIYLESYSTELKGTQMRLTYEDGISDKEPKVLKPKQILFENPKEISFESGEKTERYDVYGYGELQDSYESAGEAIRAANEINGVVVSEDQQYIWERGNRDLQYTISGKDDVIENIRSRLSQGEAPVTIMEEVMGESLDLTGCTTEELLYVINQDRPVIAMLDAQNAVILVGYTDASVIYVNVSSGERSSVSYTEMDQMTAGSGSTYIG